jgi:hypothetical protein
MSEYLKKICEEKNMPYELVKRRMKKNGWDYYRAINTPVEYTRKYAGMTSKELKEYCDQNNLSDKFERIRSRLADNWSLEDAINIPKMTHSDIAKRNVEKAKKENRSLFA